MQFQCNGCWKTQLDGKAWHDGVTRWPFPKLVKVGKLLLAHAQVLGTEGFMLPWPSALEQVARPCGGFEAPCVQQLLTSTCLVCSVCANDRFSMARSFCGSIQHWSRHIRRWLRQGQAKRCHVHVTLQGPSHWHLPQRQMTARYLSRWVCVAGIAPVPCKGSNWPSCFLDQSRGLIRGDCKSRIHATLTAVAAGPPLKQLPYVCLPVPCVLCEYDSDLCSARGPLRCSVRVHHPSIFIRYVFRKAARLLGGVKPKRTASRLCRWKFKQGLSLGMGSFDPAQPEARCGAPSVTIGTSLQARTWFGAMEEDRPLGPTESRPRPYEPFKSLHAYGDRIAACKYGLQRHHPAKVCVLCFGLLPSIS